MERDLGTSRPRIMVVGTYNQKYDELAQLTIESNFRRYCSIHNYSLWSDRMPDDFERAPQWRKIKLMIELLELNEADWLFFVDCDCLFMNMAIKVESLIDDEFDIIVSRTSGAPDFPVDVYAFEDVTRLVYRSGLSGGLERIFYLCTKLYLQECVLTKEIGRAHV